MKAARPSFAIFPYFYREASARMLWLVLILSLQKNYQCSSSCSKFAVRDKVKSFCQRKRRRRRRKGAAGVHAALCRESRVSEFTWQSGNLAPWLVVSRVAVWRQQAADNLRETDKLDIYTQRLQSKGLVTALHRLGISGRDLVRNVLLVPWLTQTPFFSDSSCVGCCFFLLFRRTGKIFGLFSLSTNFCLNRQQ